MSKNEGTDFLFVELVFVLQSVGEVFGEIRELDSIVANGGDLVLVEVLVV